MVAEPNVASVAFLLGDPARAAMIAALMGGRALTAKELAYWAAVNPPTASFHLAKLVRARLLAVVAQGRHRYYRLAGPEIAEVVEAIMGIAPTANIEPRRHSRDADEIRFARTCYDHLAGRLGVGMMDVLAERRVIRPAGNDFVLTKSGREFMTRFGIALDEVARSRRVFARQCLDWSERRPHIGGALGAALAERLFALGWLERRRNSRAVGITPKGRHALRKTFAFEA